MVIVAVALWAAQLPAMADWFGGFREDQRINQLTLMYGTDTFTSQNAFGGAIGSAAQSQLQTGINSQITTGAASLLFEFPGLTDFSGTTYPSFSMGVVNGTPASSPNPYDGNADLDWWYTPNPSEVDGGTGLPTAQLSASMSAKVLTASGAHITFTGALGAGSSLVMSSVQVAATAGASSTPLTSTGSSPGHLPSELLDPTLTSFATMSAGNLSGNISGASLSTSPIPTAFVSGGASECVENYTVSNTWLDMLVGGCKVLGGLVTVISKTQPDQVDPTATVAGAGGPYQLSANPTSKQVTTCKDHLGTTVTLATCLDAAAYSAYFNFTTDRVIGQGPVPGAVTGLTASQPGPFYVTLVWNLATGASMYTVKKASTPAGPYTVAALSQPSNAQFVTSLTPATTYYFVVVATNPGGGFTNSAPLAAMTLTLAPTSLVATQVSAHAIDLTWDATTGATSYTVKRATMSHGTYSTVASGVVGTTYHDTGLDAWTPYYYVVSASDAGGESADSGEATATTGTTPGQPNSFLGFTEYASSSQPTDILTGPDGNIWYLSANGSGAIVKVDPATGAALNTYPITGFSSPCHPSAMTIGPDRNLWVACSDALSSLLRVTTAGAMTQFGPYWSLGQAPQFMTVGSDGSLWFPQVYSIDKVNVTTGAIHRYALASTAGWAQGIASGPDGNLWFTESKNRIGRMTTAGVLTQFVIPTANSMPTAIAVGPDGNLYFTETAAHQIAQITPSGSIGEIPIPTGSADPQYITMGPDGNLWFSEPTPNKIGSVSPQGLFQEATIPTSSAGVFGLGAGPDGNLWFTEEGADKIGALGVRHSVLTLDRAALGFGNVPIGATTNNQIVTVTNHGPDPLPGLTATLSDASGASGAFAIGQVCDSGPLAPGSSCAIDVQFAATMTPGDVGGALIIDTDSGTPTEQFLSVGLTASVVPANCSVAIDTSLPSPQNVGQTVNLFGTASGCPHPGPAYRFYLRSPAGVWSIVKDWSTSTTFAWNTTAYKPGTYLIGVWVKDAQSTKTYDAYAFGTFTIQFPSCSSTNIFGYPTSPQTSGTPITFNATSAGCPNPLYQWWVRDTAAVWHIAVPYAAGDTFNWNTTGLADGTYQVGVWAKQQGSTKSYDAFAFVTFTLTVVSGTTSCQAANVDASPPSPASTATSVTLTAAAFGCDTPQYRWWVRDTAAHWAMVRDYAAGNTFTWLGASRKPGTYLVGVWARQTGSSASYQAYSFIAYTLQVPAGQLPCTSVGITPDMSSPRAVGTTVTFTAAALGCGSPTYKFFIAPPPSGVFGVVQPYGAGSTFVWDTTGLAPGPYQVGVWARNAGSTKSYEAFAFITFQLQPLVVGTPCSTLTLWPTNGSGVTDFKSQSPQPAGTAVGWFADAGGCGSAEYQFYVLSPGLPIHIEQVYSGSNAFLWDTAGLPRGTYEVVVLARQAGSGSPYDVLATALFEVS